MLRINNISLTFNKGTDNELNIFKDFSININEGETNALIGSNGSGKSTVLNLIAGTLMPDSGKIFLDGKEITSLSEEKRALNIGRVFQDPSMGVSPSLSILENLSLADKKGEAFGLRKLIRFDRINEYRERLKTLGLGLEDKLNTKVGHLSGGQRQCLSLLMAVMKHPKILLLDEHTAALDPKTSALILEKTKAILDQNKITAIMISHNMKDALNYSDRVIMLDRGKVLVDCESSKLSEDTLLEYYKKELDLALIAR